MRTKFIAWSTALGILTLLVKLLPRPELVNSYCATRVAD